MSADTPTPRNVNKEQTESGSSLLKKLCLERIVVTTDFSETSRQALPVAAALARRFGSTLTLVYAFPASVPAELSHIGLVFEQQRLAKEAAVRLVSLRERELPVDLTVETLVLEGSPAHAISKFATDRKAGLIITATHGHTGLRHLWLGSTAERIVHNAPCPVLTVRQQPTQTAASPDKSWSVQRILIPTDLSEVSHQAISYASVFAHPPHTAASLIHVVEPPPYPEFGYAHIPLREAKLKQDAQQELNALCQELANSGVSASSVIRTGNAYREITEEAKKESSDLIIIATKGHGTIAHALLGSTAERVVRHASCPVLVVRQLEHQG
jgi:nucleotide-binding universal stress UspA family protein